MTPEAERGDAWLKASQLSMEKQIHKRSITESPQSLPQSNSDLASFFIDKFFAPELREKYTLHAAQIAALNKLQPINSEAGGKQPPMLCLLTRNFDIDALYKRTIDASLVFDSFHFRNEYRSISSSEIVKDSGFKQYDVFGRKWRHSTGKCLRTVPGHVIDFKKLSAKEHKAANVLFESQPLDSPPTGESLEESPREKPYSGFNFPN